MVNPHIYTVIMGRLSRLDIAISNRLTTHDYILSRQPTQKSPVIHTSDNICNVFKDELQLNIRTEKHFVPQLQ